MPLVRKTSFHQPLLKNGQKSLTYTSDTDGGGDSLAVFDCCATTTHARIPIGTQMSFIPAVLAKLFMNLWNQRPTLGGGMRLSQIFCEKGLPFDSRLSISGRTYVAKMQHVAGMQQQGVSREAK